MKPSKREEEYFARMEFENKKKMEEGKPGKWLKRKNEDQRHSITCGVRKAGWN
jgi:hypothetical protein